ncbi:MAG: tetratricopeptide repeat protein [Candidatus Hydrogenedentes bacterium]|nr:tetratricopeptide repeat protein [Candidatus Hydrogenedentota bacterium]
MSATILIVASLLTAQGNAYTETFTRANDHYKTGDYSGAIQAFEQLVSEQAFHAAVFYNLGNAYYRAGKLAPAIANYERALQLDPGFDSARQNLAHCVSETQQRLARPLPPDWEQSLLFWHYHLPSSVTRWLALAFWLAFWITLAIRQFRPARYVQGVAAVTAILALAFGASAWAKSSTGTLAVAADEAVPVRYGTDLNQTVRFELHEGDRVTVDRRERGWARVKTAGGETGWTPDSSLIFVGPPYEPTTPKSAQDPPQSGNTK